MKEQKMYYGLLDYFKLFAAVLIIAIHTYPLGSFNASSNFILTNIFARIGVPFFFMVTGFFLLPKCLEPTNGLSSLLHFFQKTGKFYAIAILLYLPINIYNGYFKIKEIEIRMIKDIFIEGTFYHLWYLPAVLTGVLLVFILIKTMGTVVATMSTVFLFIIGLLGDSYYGLVKSIPLLKNSYDALFNLFDYTRNGFFFAPIFLILGYLIFRQISAQSLEIKEIELQKKADKHSIKKYSFLFLFFLCLLIGEGMLLYSFKYQRHTSMYLMLVPALYYLFLLLLSISRYLMIPATIEIRKTSMLVYLLHPFFIILVRGFGKMSGLEWLLVQNSMIHFIFVTISTILFSYIIIFMKGEKTV